ncbi:MAG: HEAT repeat domain-containing protein [Methanosarcinaceae archaeon]
MNQEEIHKKCLSDDPKERIEALQQLRDNFSLIHDKEQAWKDIHRLTNDENNGVRWWAAKVLSCVFKHKVNNEGAWNDLHKLITDQDYDIKCEATITLGSVFSCLPDKQQAYDDLHRLTIDEDSYLKEKAVKSLGTAFSYLPDKQQACNDFHRLTNDAHRDVRIQVVEVLGSAYPNLPDKQQAYNDLHRLLNDDNWDVRWKAMDALVSAWPHVPDQQQAWNELIKRTNDEHSDVRIYANHSLGRISIFKASLAENEDDYRKELERAIVFYQVSAQESFCEWLNPSKFCLPFYRSFYTIISAEKKQVKEEVEKYLLEAKNAIKGSENKKLLFDAVENLAYALKEVQNLENMDLAAKKGELDFYRKYCEQATELMKNTEKTAPFATATMKKGLPILDRKLKSLLEEIQEKAKTACRESQGTDTEEIACAVSREVQKWEIGSQEEMTQNIEGLIETFRMRMPHLPGYDHIFEEIEGIRDEKDLAKQYKIVSTLVGLIPIFSSMPDHVIQDIKDIKEKTTSVSDDIKYLQTSVDRLTKSVDELQNPQEYLDTIQRNLEEIKNDIPEMKEKIDEVLYELYSPLSTTQKLKVAIPLIPMLAIYEVETNVPKLVADKISELKNLVLHIKKK